MNVTSNWQNVTRNQLKQVAPPHPGTARRLEQTESFTAGAAAEEASQKARRSHYTWQDARNTSIGATVVAVPLTAILAANGATGLAAAAGCIGGAVALGAGYFGMNARADRNGWERFQKDLQSWAGSAAENLTRPGSQPNTVENHAFFEAGAFKNLYDVRQDGVVISRHAELENGLKLHEDVKSQTVTAETASGVKAFPRASLELPTGDQREPALRLKTWNGSDQAVVQSIDHKGESEVTFADRHPMVVFPNTTLAYGRTPGAELPDGTLRFEYERQDSDYYNKKFDVLFATPPLTGRDFQADFAVAPESTLTHKFELGQSVFRNHPASPLAPLTVQAEPREKGLLTHHVELPGTGAELIENVATGQVNLVKDGQILQTRQGHLDVNKGLLAEKDVTQHLMTYPSISLDSQGTMISVDANDNVKAGNGLPARLIDGRIVELGTGDKARQIEIPVPRRTWG